jgi:outer membrane protein assembly factor BamE
MADHIATGLIMPALVPSRVLLALTLTVCAALSGCSSFDKASVRIAEVITPYKLEVVQGNFVASEQVQLLKAGLTRAQVRELLGTPMVTSTFRDDRWDYAFSLRRQGVQTQSRRLTVFFKGDVLERFENDPMPTEAEFVASLDTVSKSFVVPVLEASPESLKAFAPPLAAQPKEAELPPLPLNYPPLEAPAR